MQKGEMNRCPSVCRERPQPWVELLWTRGRKARLVLPQEGRGVVRGVVEHAIASSSSLPGQRASARESK